MQAKPIYTTYTFYYFLRTLFTRVVLLGATGYLSFHFKENPVVIGILVGITALLFLTSGKQYVSVYEDRFTVKNDALIMLFNKRPVYYYSDIKAVAGEPKPTVQDVVAYSVFRFLFPQRANHLHSLYIELKNGATVKLQLDIYLADLEKLTTVIQQQLVKQKRRSKAEGSVN